MVPFYLLGIGIGTLFLMAAVFNWEWLLFADRESRLWEALGGETMVRVWWAITGTAIIGGVVWHWLARG